MINAGNLFIPKDVEDHTDHIITDPVEQYVVRECIFPVQLYSQNWKVLNVISVHLLLVVEFLLRAKTWVIYMTFRIHVTSLYTKSPVTEDMLVQHLGNSIN